MSDEVRSDAVVVVCHERQYMGIASCVGTGWPVIQLAMDVDADFRATDTSPQANMFVDAVITPDGMQVRPVWSESCYPGTKNTVLTIRLLDAWRGSTFKIQTESNSVGYNTHSFVVPPLDEFQPAPWW